MREPLILQVFIPLLYRATTSCELPSTARSSPNRKNTPLSSASLPSPLSYSIATGKRNNANNPPLPSQPVPVIRGRVVGDLWLVLVACGLRFGLLLRLDSFFKPLCFHLSKAKFFCFIKNEEFGLWGHSLAWGSSLPSNCFCLRDSLPAELSAGGGDVVAFFPPQCGWNSAMAQGLEEAFLLFERWASPFQSGHAVVGD